MWNLLTNNLDSNKTIVRNKLSLFSTRGNSPPIVTVDYQNLTSYQKRPEYESVRKEELPIPENYRLYVGEGFYRIDGYTEVYNLNLLTKNAYYKDYSNFQTIIVSDEESFILEKTLILSEFDFEKVIENSSKTLIYRNLDLENTTISKIESEGLEYFPATSHTPHTFSFEIDLTLYATTRCCPRDSSEIVLSLETSNSTLSSFEVYSFEGLDLDFVDLITYKNQSYKPSNILTTGSLIFNNLEKKALCLY